MWIPDLQAHPGPRYQAIAEAIGTAIRGGELSGGDRLPPQRELAWKLGVTVGTVSRGYTLAEQRGLLSGEVGRGTYVRTTPTASDGSSLSVDHGDSLDMSVNTASVPGRAALLADVFRDLANGDDMEAALRYMPSAGHPRHRGALVPWLKRHDIDHAKPESIVLTAGAAQGLMLSMAVLTQAGEPVMAERLTYPGVIEAAHLLNRPLVALDMDEDGVTPDALERAAVDRGARVAVLVPTIQNPTASVMSEQRRRDIVAVAEKRDLLLVEDDVYGNLPESHPPALVSLAPERTVYLSSASKCLAPGLRAGWMLAPERYVSRLVSAVYATSVAQPAFTFEIVARWIESGAADQLVKDLREETAARQKITADIMGDFSYSTHPNAFHIFLNLPSRWRGGVFAEAAATKNIRIMPASSFMVGDDHAPRAVRVCISRPPDRESLTRGLHILHDLAQAGPSAGRTMV